MNINPSKLAQSIFKSASNLELTRIKNNLNNFGYSIFKQFNFNDTDIKIFKNEFIKLANERGI